MSRALDSSESLQDWQGLLIITVVLEELVEFFEVGPILFVPLPALLHDLVRVLRTVHRTLETMAILNEGVDP